jgi:hypothetical protein
MENIALTEAEGPDLKVHERRRRDCIEAAKRLGLDRQARMLLAEKHYARFSPERFLLEVVTHNASHSVWWDVKNIAAEPCRLNCGIASSRWQMNAVESYNRPIPYAILLGLEEARQAEVFDRFAIMAPQEHWGLVTLYQRSTPDPALVGAIDGPTRWPHHAIYFFIGRWD